MTRVSQLKNFPTSEAASLLNAKIEEKGVKNIGWVINSVDSMVTSSNSPLVTPADFKGVKIRGLNKVFDTGFAAMGASPSAMPGSEVYQALQTGVIDAGLTGVESVNTRRFYEVQKYGTAIRLFTIYHTVVVNPAWWEKLPADARKGIESAMRKAEETMLPTSDAIAPEGIDALRQKGMSITVLNAKQEKELAIAMQPPVLKAYTEQAPDAAKLIELVRKL